VERVAAAGAPDHYLVLARSIEDRAAARTRAAADRWGLTVRQTEVLALLAAGRSNRAIAAALGCAERTVEQHVTALHEKTGCAHRAELVARFWTSL
jgi:DNA-binding CsgD family transcriptional regulator